MLNKFLHFTWTKPNICLQERVAQSMHKIILYARNRSHKAGLIAWEMRYKMHRHIHNSQNDCPQVNHTRPP